MFLAGIAVGFALGILARPVLRFITDLEIVNLAIIALGPKRQHTIPVPPNHSTEHAHVDVGECTGTSTVGPAQSFAKGA